MQRTTSEKYSRIARVYDLIEYPMERLLFRASRAEAVSHARGKTLEVGVGTGKNLFYYPSEIELIAFDFSPGMLAVAQRKTWSVPSMNIRLYVMDVQNLAFADNTFDTVISTFVFCTVPDPIAGLREVYRVLRPGGRAVFLEHMKSKNRLMNLFLHGMNFFSTRILGTSMVRETQKNIESAEFVVESVDNKALDVVRLIIAGKKSVDGKDLFVGIAKSAIPAL